MNYTWRSALIDGAIVLILVLFCCLGFYFSDSGGIGRETNLISQVCISLYLYVLSTVLLLSFFFPDSSAIFYIVDVYFREAAPFPSRHEKAGIAWGIFGYVVGTVGLVHAFVGGASQPTIDQAEQAAARRIEPPMTRVVFSDSDG